MTTTKPSITAFIVCLNEERNIARCLKSLDWCEQIIVVDSGSSDRTLEICAQFNAKVIHQDWLGYVGQKRFALEQCQTEWIINLDADEEVSDELKQEIYSILSASSSSNYDGFELLRVVFYLGRWWRRGGWHPEYRLRLCRRLHTTWHGTEPHEYAQVTGETTRLRGELRHYTYDGVFEHVTALNKYARISANAMYKRGDRTFFLSGFGHALARFIKFYIIRHGYREGRLGLLVAVIEAFGGFLKYSHLWLRQRGLE